MMTDRISAVALIASILVIEASPSRSEELLVADLLTNSVQRYDASTGAPLGTFASGGGLSAPHGLTFGPDGNLYVSSFSSDQILVYSRASGAFLGVFASSEGPYNLQFGADGDLYVVSDSSGVSRFDGATGAPLGIVIPLPGPESANFYSMAIGPDDKMYIGGLMADFSAGNIVRYDYHTGAFLDVFAVGFDNNGPRRPVWDANGDVLSADLNDGVVRKFDGTTGASLGTFADPPSNGSVATLLTGGSLLVSGVWTQKVYRHDATTGAYIGDFISGVAVADMLVRPAAVCGNAFVDAGEDCDQGASNGTSGSCCSAVCQFRASGGVCRPSAGACDLVETCSGASASCPLDAKSSAECRPSAGQCDAAESCDGIGNDCPADAPAPNGTSCSDGDGCTTGDVCAGFVCQGGGTISCDDGNSCTQDSCVAPGGCVNDATPLLGCKLPGRAVLVIKDRGTESADRVVWKWLRGDSSLADFGNPTLGTEYGLCVFDESGDVPNPIFDVRVAASPNWSAVGTKGFNFRDTSASADGAFKFVLRQGTPDRAKALFVGKGTALNWVGSPLPFDQDGAVLVQMHNSAGECWESRFTPPATRNQPDLFKDVAP